MKRIVIIIALLVTSILHTPLTLHASEQEQDFVDFDIDSIPNEIPDPIVQEPISIPITLPFLGTVNLVPYKEGDKDGLKADFPRKGTLLRKGPLSIQDGEIRLIGEQLLYSAQVTLFGKTGLLALKEYKKIADKDDKSKSYSRIKFGIDFAPSQLPTLELIPGKQATLESVDVVLEKPHAPQIIANANILGKKLPITFTLGKEATDASATLENVPLSQIISQVKDTALQDATLIHATLIIKNIYVKKGIAPRKPIMTLSGTIDLSKTPGLSDNTASVRAVQMQAATIATGATFEASISSLPIKDIGHIDNAHIVGAFTTDLKEVKIDGTGIFDIKDIGSFNLDIAGSLDQKGFVIASTLNQTLAFAGINVTNAQLKFESITKTISILGDALIQGYQTKLAITRNAAGTINAQAALLKKTIQPFASLPVSVPGLKDIEVLNPMFKLEHGKQGYETVLTGDVILFGVPLHSTMHVRRNHAGQAITLLEVQGEQNWKLSNGYSKFKNTVFDDIELNDLYFILSSAEYRDTTRNVTFKQGMNIIAKTHLTGSLAPVAEFSGTPGASNLTLTGYIASDNPLNSALSIQIPSSVVIKKDEITINNLSLEVGKNEGDPLPSFGLNGVMVLKPRPQDEPLNLTANISFSPINADISATMLGTWKQPLGIKGLELSNVATDIAVTLPALPKDIGMTGHLKLGKQDMEVAIKLPIAGSADLVACGAINKLTLADFASIAANMVGQQLDFKSLPEVGFDDVKIYIAPKATKIGKVEFAQGLNMHAKFGLPGFTAEGMLNVSMLGIVAQAYATQIKWGPLVIGKSKKEAPRPTAPEKPVELDTTQVAVKCAPTFNGPIDMPKEGPVVNLVLTLSDQQLLVSGSLKIGDIVEDDTYIKMSGDGIEFNFFKAIGTEQFNGQPLLAAMINGKSAGSLSSPKFKLIVDFEQNLLVYIAKQTTAAIAGAQQTVKENIDSAIKDVESLSKTQAEANAKINAAKDEAFRKLQDARNTVNGLQKDIDAMQQRIDNEKRRFNALPWYEQSYEWAVSGGKITGWGTALAALWASKKTADGILAQMQKIADGFLEEVGKPVAQGTLEAAKQAGTGILTGAKEGTVGLLEGTKMIVNGTLTALDIRKVHYEGNLENFATGMLGNVLCKATIVGQDVNFNFDLDLKQPYKGLEKLANKLGDAVQAALKNLKVSHRDRIDAHNDLQQYLSYSVKMPPLGNIFIDAWMTEIGAIH